jgi:hypothetical protein
MGKAYLSYEHYEGGGRRRIRTFVGVSQQIYSLLGMPFALTKYTSGVDLG